MGVVSDSAPRGMDDGWMDAHGPDVDNGMTTAHGQARPTHEGTPLLDRVQC